MPFEVTQHKAGHRNRLIHPDPVWLELNLDPYRPLAPAAIERYDRHKSRIRFYEFVASPHDEDPAAGLLKVLGQLRGAREPIAVELIGNREFFRWQFVVQANDAALLQLAISTAFANSYLQSCSSDCLYDHYQAIKAQKLRREYHLLDYASKPLPYEPVFNESALGKVDLILHVQSVSEQLGPDELAFYQVIFQPCRSNWGRLYQQMAQWELLVTPEQRSSTGRVLKNFSEARGLFAIALRVGTFVAEEKAGAMMRRLDAVIRNVSLGDHRLRRLTRADYFQHGLPRTDQLYLLFNRVAFREGIVVAERELAVLLPYLTPQFLERARGLTSASRTYAAPALSSRLGVSLGVNLHKGHSQDVFVGPQLPNEHVYIVGKSGYGKSTLMERMISQHLETGEGFGVIDPHGDLLARVLALVPESRISQTVYFNPVDPASRIPFNILAHNGSQREKEHLRADLLDFFEELIGEKLGVNIEHILNYALTTLLYRKDSTLADIKRLLTDSSFRASILSLVPDPEVPQFWSEEFPGWAKAGSLLTITNKLSPLLLPGGILAPLLSGRTNGLNFTEMMDHQGILLCDLSQGALTRRNSKLLGRLVLSRIVITAMMRDPSRQRPGWHLYVDEVQDLAGRSLEEILRGGRKFGLHLRLANQARKDLPESLRLAIGNAATMVFFCLDDVSEQVEAEKLLGRKFSAAELGSLPRGHAMVKMAGQVFNLTVPRVEVPRAGLASRIIEHTRRRFTGPESAQEQASTEVAQPPLTHKRQEQTRQAGAAASAAEAPTATREAPRVSPLESSVPGRGGQQHKYLQQLIRRWAESKGYRATIEKQILDGLGSVDVVLEKDGRSIACEISVTSTTDQEAGNIQKCLVAGFEHVVLVSLDQKVLGKARDAISTALSKEQIKRVRFLTPEQLFAFIETLEAKVAGREAAGDSKELLTAKEVEALLRIAVKTIYSYVQRGLIPYVRIQSNVRFLKSEILNWVAERRFRPSPRK